MNFYLQMTGRPSRGVANTARRRRGRPPGPARGRGQDQTASQSRGQSEGGSRRPSCGRGRPRRFHPYPDRNANDPPAEAGDDGANENIDPGEGSSRGPGPATLSHHLIIPDNSSSESEEDALHSDEEFPLDENDIISDREEEADEDEEDDHSGDIRPHRDRLVHDIESARDPGNYNR